MLSFIANLGKDLLGGVNLQSSPFPVFHGDRLTSMEQESEEEKIQAVLPCPEKQEATELKEC